MSILLQNVQELRVKVIIIGGRAEAASRNSVEEWEE